MMNILIAEDEIGIAQTYEMLLVAKGHAVTLTEDGLDCLKIYKERLAQLGDISHECLSENPPFDVVVLDYRLPSMDGIDVAKQILLENPRQQIIFASAYITETLAESVKKWDQVVELLHKPFELEVLLDAIVNSGLERTKGIEKQAEISEQCEHLRMLLQELKRSKINSQLASNIR